MEIYETDEDVKVFYIQASSFLDGVKEAWEKLHALIGDTNDRKFYGISHGGKNGIVYKAAVQENSEGEGERLGCKTLVIPSGEYLSILISDYMNHIPLIGQAFRRLVAHPGFDGVTPCIEWYKNDSEVVCMVKKKLQPVNQFMHQTV